jgi:D-alanyl-D-alanine carboxypeptidase/D-alanyl-D-alanine-endopeptidase (penicillin-binding protein 4)
MFKRLLLLAFLLLAAPALAQQQAVEAALETAPKGTRFGLLVVDEAGRELIAIAPDQRFIPASNTKLFTTAAAYALLPGIDQPDAAGGTQVALRAGAQQGAPDAVLLGRGDARMSSALNCKVNCLGMLADAIAAKTKVVGDVIGDDTWFPDQRWSPGMSWNNLGTEDATAASALSLDSNELTLRAVPGELGKPPILDVSPYVTVLNDATTVAAGKSRLSLEHTLNSRQFRLYGTLALDASEWRTRIGLDDPAHFAAWTFARMLRARGVRVKGQVRAVHRPVTDMDDPDAPLQGAFVEIKRINSAPGSTLFGFMGNDMPILASLAPPPLSEDVVIINKLSQNHHSEILLRRIAHQHTAGATLAGLEKARLVFEQAGIPRHGYDFSDGSGMSTYNRLSPRATVALLRWAATQPWGEKWYASLPIAGIDGTLKRRFLGTPLAGNLAAKTGTLNATNALSGRFRANSGRMLTFAFFANDVPDGTSAVAAMEAALLAVSEAN